MNYLFSRQSSVTSTLIEATRFFFFVHVFTLGKIKRYKLFFYTHTHTDILFVIFSCFLCMCYFFVLISFNLHITIDTCTFREYISLKVNEFQRMLLTFYAESRAYIMHPQGDSSHVPTVKCNSMALKRGAFERSMFQKEPCISL